MSNSQTTDRLSMARTSVGYDLVAVGYDRDGRLDSARGRSLRRKFRAMGSQLGGWTIRQGARRYGLVQDRPMNGPNMSTSMMLTTPLALRSKRLSYPPGKIGVAKKRTSMMLTVVFMLKSIGQASSVASSGQGSAGSVPMEASGPRPLAAMGDGKPSQSGSPAGSDPGGRGWGGVGPAGGV